MTLLEVCIDSAEGLMIAAANGADRVELCSALELGGLTPSAGLLAIAGKAGIAARAMIRPRGGDFVFDAAEIDHMLADIAAVQKTGIEGVVLGANRSDGRLDMATLARLIEASHGLKLTLHRAFDLVPDIDEAIDQAIELGFDTILTSGRARTAAEGLKDLIHAFERAAGRITVMPGSGVSARTVANLLQAAPFGAVHGSCAEPAQADSEIAVKLGFESQSRRTTSAKQVAQMKKSLNDRH